MQKKKIYNLLHEQFFFKKNCGKSCDYRNNLHPKAVFVLAENIFRKSFYMKPCVWLRMENRFFRKIIYFDLENIFNFCFTFKSFPETCKERKRERKDSQMCKQREREREREREIAPSSLRSSRLDRRPHPLHVTVRSRHEPTNWSTHLVHRRDHATNPRTDRRPRPLHVTVRSPRTHEPIDPPRPLARSRHEPMNRSTHPSSSPTNPRTDCATIGLVILIFFSFDFCFLCCLYASIICNNICLDPKKMWETW